MNRMRQTTLAALAVLGTLAVTPALAAPNAYVISDTVLYKSANASSQQVNYVEAGQLVMATECTTNYCFLDVPGTNGWIRKSLLGALKKGKPANNAPFSFSLGIGADGKPSFSIGVGNTEADDIEIEDPEVCFFKSKGYEGSSFCVEPGDSDDSLPGSWDNSISSISVSGGAEVVVCSGDDLTGTCASISSSKKSLPSQLDNKISSYEVE